IWAATSTRRGAHLSWPSSAGAHRCASRRPHLAAAVDCGTQAAVLLEMTCGRTNLSASKSASRPAQPRCPRLLRHPCGVPGGESAEERVSAESQLPRGRQARVATLDASRRRAFSLPPEWSLLAVEVVLVSFLVFIFLGLARRHVRQF